MYREASYGGKFWMDVCEPRWADWRGRQRYKYQVVGRSPGERGR